MLFCQLGHAKSLREICGGLAASEGKLRHLGLPTAPSRSTLAYANEHRPWQLQQTIFEQLLAKCQILVASQPETRKKRKFRFNNVWLAKILLGFEIKSLWRFLSSWWDVMPERCSISCGSVWAPLPVCFALVAASY